MKPVRTILAALCFSTVFAAATRADSAADDCLSEDYERRITGCTSIIEDPAAAPLARSLALANRGLALSIKGLLERAIDDYNASLKINPNSASALNNRAWAYFRSGRGRQGLPDIERSLLIDPGSEHSWDTRAHIRQLMGNFDGAIRDYETAISLGGERMVKIYQCGLVERGLYQGRMHGIYDAETKEALRTCAKKPDCDPLPADEKCDPPSS
jgi:tetratricopeptide (TPR) repeat protein